AADRQPAGRAIADAGRVPSGDSQPAARGGRRPMKPRRLRGTIAVACGATAVFSVRLGSYVYSGRAWPRRNIVMQMQLGSSNGTLIDGSDSWGTAAEGALASWNNYMGRVSFRVVRNSTAAIAGGNGQNNVFWSATAYGKDFDDYASPTQTNG